MNNIVTGTTLSFVEMQAFINYVVDNTLTYGMGYKDVLIKYCTAKYYGKVEFKSDEIAEIYDSEYEKLCCGELELNVKQLDIIISAIDNELDRRIKLLSASMVMSDANDAIANLANKILAVVESIGENNFSSNDIKTIANAIGNIKENVTADSLVKAMVDNGVIKGKKTTKKTTKAIKLDTDRTQS